jgi:hypothetical protein
MFIVWPFSVFSREPRSLWIFLLAQGEIASSSAFSSLGMHPQHLHPLQHSRAYRKEVDTVITL